MKSCFFILFALFLLPEVKATHIVGGGFSYRQTSVGNYRFTLTLYFDFVNGNSGAKDANAICHIFRKSNNQFVDSLFFPLVDSSQYLKFTNPNCASKVNIKTQVLVYASNLFMGNARYNDPAGYYIIWERCCRNNTISNIKFPGETGQTFYMEFPPVFRNGGNFNNNSPAFEPIKSDYPCIFEPFQISFQAKDPDGDSLKYSLTTPLRGNSTTARPRGTPPLPAPYPLVNWEFGYNANNPLPGNPSLTVNPQTGLLNCRATAVGLYVFSVKCEEFRNNVKIGEVRLEMQISVVDCEANNKPAIVVQNEFGIKLAQNDTLYLTSSPITTCRTIKLVDKERNEPINYQLIGASDNVPSSIELRRTVNIGVLNDSASVSFCIPPCGQASAQDPWKIWMIATDNGCSLPKTDSLLLNFVVKPVPGIPPLLKTVDVQPDTIIIPQTGILTVPMIATQSQGGDLKITSSLVDSKGNPLSPANLVLPRGTGKGNLNATLYWPEICIFPENQPLKFETIVESNVCGELKYDTLFTYLRIVPKQLTIFINSSFSGDSKIVLNEEQSVSFTLKGDIVDQRPIQLFAIGPLKDQPGYSFSGGEGNGTVSDEFKFATTCGGTSGTYPIKFKVTSLFCEALYQDSISYDVNLEFEPDTLGTIPNLLTVNGDTKNDYFSLDGISAKETCANQFEFIEIYNRWGKRIFYSKDRNFKWVPDDKTEGIFWFGLNFKNKRISSWLMLVH